MIPTNRFIATFAIWFYLPCSKFFFLAFSSLFFPELFLITLCNSHVNNWIPDLIFCQGLVSSEYKFITKLNANSAVVSFYSMTSFSTNRMMMNQLSIVTFLLENVLVLSGCFLPFFFYIRIASVIYLVALSPKHDDFYSVLNLVYYPHKP